MTDEPINEDPAPGAPDWDRLRTWTDNLFCDAAALPISFFYAGEAIHGLPDEWRPSRQFARVTSRVTQTVYRGTHPRSPLELRVEVIGYDDYPIVEWTAWFTNLGDRPSEVIERPRPIDTVFTGGTPTVRHCNGDLANADGYRWQGTELAGSESVEAEPQLGRPCNGAFPYFRVLFDGCGFSLAIGWPGQWRAEFRPEGNGIRVEAGQAAVHLRLQPGESVRTPRVSLLAWDGGEERSVNLWRRWYREHVMPRPGGRQLGPLVQVSATDEGPGGEYTAATEENQLAYQGRFAEAGLPYDVWWLDAGWYACQDDLADGPHWCVTGNWFADPERFPAGLGPVSDNAAKYGAQFLLWFEPERVFPGTSLHQEHPEWLLDRPGWTAHDRPPRPDDEPARSFWLQDISNLLDLSDESCRAWLAEMVSERIGSYRVGIYRQDFNYGPLEFWQAHDTPERHGAKENLYVQGYLEFWDTLLARHKDILIDSCASGGRRNDLETMRRSVPLHFTDFGYGLHPVKLDFQRTMHEWLPYFNQTIYSWDIADARRNGIEAAEADSFAFHCALAPMLGLSIDIRRSEDYDLDLVREMIAIWRRAATIIVDADYYALTPPGRTGKDWVGRQFCRRDGREGFVQAIRHAGSDEEQHVLCPRRIVREAWYELEEPERGERRQVEGSALREHGLRFALGRRSASIWFYRQVAEDPR